MYAIILNLARVGASIKNREGAALGSGVGLVGAAGFRRC